MVVIHKNVNLSIDRESDLFYTNLYMVSYYVNMKKVFLIFGGREIQMSKTVVRKNESLEDALRRFKRSVSKSGTIQEVRKREFYEKPSVKRKKKSEAARKRKFR